MVLVGAYEYSVSTPVKYHPMNHVINNTQEEDTLVTEYEMIPININIWSSTYTLTYGTYEQQVLDSYGRAGELYQ